MDINTRVVNNIKTAVMRISMRIFENKIQYHVGNNTTLV